MMKADYDLMSLQKKKNKREQFFQFVSGFFPGVVKDSFKHWHPTKVPSSDTCTDI